jgi:hypothetical protein
VKNTSISSEARQINLIRSQLGGPADGRMATLMKPSVIVWELETVPDLGGFTVSPLSQGFCAATTGETLSLRWGVILL